MTANLEEPVIEESNGEPRPESLAVLDAPPERIGLLLADARTRRGLGLAEACRLSGVLEPAEMMALEGGAFTVDSETFEALSGLYGVSPSDLVPPRDHLVVDLREGYLRAGGEISLLSDGVGRHDVLSRYLEMIWEIRSVDPGTDLSLRVADMEVLGESFDDSPASVRRDLLAMMGEQIRSAPRRRVLVSLGAAIAVVTGGVLMWQAASGPAAAEPVIASSPAVVTAQTQLPYAPEAKIGDAEVMERGGDQQVRSGDLPPAPTAAVGDAALQERNPDGTPGPQGPR
ncbi:MAG: hypothetical protein ACK5O2_01835 [Microthrixaceae bacterium]